MFLVLSTWINIPIRSFYFLEILGLNFYEFANEALRNLTLALRTVVRYIGALRLFNYTTHVR